MNLEHVDELASKIHDRISSGQMTKEDLSFIIRHHWDDAARIVKNINQTSLNGADRFNRIVEFEGKTGLSKTHLL